MHLVFYFFLKILNKTSRFNYAQKSQTNYTLSIYFYRPLCESNLWNQPSI
jgi:hypothetical protein